MTRDRDLETLITDRGQFLVRRDDFDSRVHRQVVRRQASRQRLRAFAISAAVGTCLFCLPIDWTIWVVPTPTEPGPASLTSQAAESAGSRGSQLAWAVVDVVSQTRHRPSPNIEPAQRQ